MKEFAWKIDFKYEETHFDTEIYLAPTEKLAIAKFWQDNDEQPIEITSCAMVLPYGLTHEDIGIEYVCRGMFNIIADCWGSTGQSIFIYTGGGDKIYIRPTKLWRTNFGWRQEQ